jgi:hypothetical protein
MTRARGAEAESPREGSLKERYEEFCRAKFKDHLRALPQAIRSRMFEELRSSLRREAPQLRRNELDEMAHRVLKIQSGEAAQSWNNVNTTGLKETPVGFRLTGSLIPG